ncbi:MAG: hypothetical protein K6G71_09940 [Clostridiales bacterium]|nr:hypothetical protein [Clostridiales bacterium]
MTYVVSGINGEKELFNDLLTQIDFRDRDEMIIAGGIIDYGGDSVALIQDLSMRDNVFPVAGPNELAAAKVLPYCVDPAKKPPQKVAQATRDWFAIGGKSTFEQFAALDREDREAVVDYLSDIPFYETATVSGKYHLIMSGVPEGLRDGCGIETFTEADFLNTDFDPDEVRLSTTVIISGGKPVEDVCPDEPDSIYTGKGVTLINCGLINGGRLAALRLNDGAVFYVP